MLSGSHQVANLLLWESCHASSLMMLEVMVMTSFARPVLLSSSTPVALFCVVVVVS